VRICVWMHHKPWGFNNTATTICGAVGLTARNRRAGVLWECGIGGGDCRGVGVE